jgi:hypothetical protein
VEEKKKTFLSSTRTKNIHLNAFERSQIMAKQKLQLQKPQQEQAARVGLECLDDQTLADIVATDVCENQQIKSSDAAIAFKELARRSGHDV